MGEGVVGREGWEREWRAGKDGGESSEQGGMGDRVVGREGWGRVWWAVREGIRKW